MQSNRVTKPVEEREEAAVGETSMVESKRKVYHTPELVELGGMKQRTKGSGTGISDSILQLSGELIPGDSGS
ncbi:MAG: hypothetical protein ABXS91_10425 [Sulfurimonas sp.]